MDGDPWQRLTDWLASVEAGEVPAYAGVHGLGAEHLTIIDKATIRRSGSDYLSRAVAGQQLWWRSTSGTTGAPATFFFDRVRHFEQMLLAVPKIVFRSEVLSAFRRSVLCLHLTDTQSSRSSVIADPLGLFGLMLRGVFNQAKPGSLERVAEWIRELRPAVLTARPEIYAVLLAEPVIEAALREHPPDLLVSSGSELPPALEHDLAERVGAPVSTAYGLCEFGVVASRCPACQRLHLDDPSLVLELDTDAQGEAIISGLGNAAMPLLRYRTGDRLSLVPNDCSTGAPGPAIAGVTGRLVPPFRFSGGRVFSPTHFTNLFELFPIREYQLTQLDPSSVVLAIETEVAEREVAALLDVLKRHLEAALPEDVAVEVRRREFGTEKIARFRSLCGVR